MIVLTIRTDKPEAELGLFDDSQQFGYESWQAHKELSVTVHQKIEKLLKEHNKGWRDIEGIVCFKGPGSFTGLRIGLTVGNSIAESLHIPVVGESGDGWLKTGINRLLAGENDKVAMPEYGQDPHITQQKK